MSLDALLHFISSGSSEQNGEADLAFAEVSPTGTIASINPFARLTWGWRVGSPLPQDLMIALECLDGEEPTELPVTLAGLHLKGLSQGPGRGWFVIGYEPNASTAIKDQFSFRTLMDRIPQPAMCLTTSGLSKYVNEAVGCEFKTDPSTLVGRPILSELIYPEDRWKIADLMELAARDGSAQSPVRYGKNAATGILHLVQSVGEEFQAIIMPMAEEFDMIHGSYVQESAFQSFLEQGPIGVLYLDAENRVTFENHYFRGLVGEEVASSWLGLQLSNVIHLSAKSIQQLEAAVHQKEATACQIELLDPATRTVNRYVHIHVSAIWHPDGKRMGATLLVEDRTEVVLQERELTRLAEAQKIKNGLRELATNISNPALFRDEAVVLLGKATEATRVTLLGLSVSKDRMVEIASWSTGEEVVPLESIDRYELAYFESLAGGQVLQHNDIVGSGLCDRLEAATCWIAPISDNGQFAGFIILSWNQAEWVGSNWASDPTFAANGTPAVTSTRPGSLHPGRLAFFEEIVQLFESLYSWIQLGSRYRTTVASIDDALFGFCLTKDASRQYHFATDQFSVLTGFEPAQILDSDSGSINWMSDVVHEEDLPLVRTHNMTLQEGHESRITYRIYHRDGSVRWLREHATPRTDSTGMTAVNGIISDVSEQKAAELVLLQAKKEAEASDRSKTAFIATLSHEIRTPLGAVHGFARLLEKEMEEFEEELSEDLPEHVHEFLSAISERSQKLLSLVDDLFELSNIEMGKVTMQKATVSLPHVVEASVEKIRKSGERKGLSIQMYSRSSQINVIGEGRKIGQVMDNLLSNALKFTEEGSISVQVTSTKTHAVVEVKDTGVGIGEDYLDNLFEAFSQEEDWRNRKYEGTGLGLALVRRLVELMDGEVEVNSFKGQGSSFIVRLPLAPAQTPSQVGLGALSNATEPSSWTPCFPTHTERF